MNEKLNLIYKKNIPVEIDLEEIISWASNNMEIEDAVEFIKKFEASFECYDTAELLYEHFKKIHEEYLKL